MIRAGVASLYPVLFDQRVLTSSCGEERALECAAVAEAEEGGAAAEEGVDLGDKCCEAQQLQYTLISSVALFMADGIMLAYGEIADRQASLCA